MELFCWEIFETITSLKQFVISVTAVSEQSSFLIRMIEKNVRLILNRVL